MPVPVEVLCAEAPPLVVAEPKVTEILSVPPKPGVTPALADAPVVESEAEA